MNSKPKLIDLEFLKKISGSVNKEKDPSISSKVGGYIKDSFVHFFTNYSDLIIVIMILSTILYFRYKFIMNEKIKKKKPDVLEVNYHRTNDYIDGSLVNTKDNMDTSRDIDNDIMRVVKDKIIDFENDLQPADMAELNGYHSI